MELVTWTTRRDERPLVRGARWRQGPGQNLLGVSLRGLPMWREGDRQDQGQQRSPERRWGQRRPAGDSRCHVRRPALRWGGGRGLCERDSEQGPTLAAVFGTDLGRPKEKQGDRWRQEGCVPDER